MNTHNKTYKASPPMGKFNKPSKLTVIAVTFATLSVVPTISIAATDALDSELIDLGTLTSDNSGNSSITTISADGRVVVGQADTDSSGYSHAYRYNKGDAKMTDLGTLKSDNSGYSYAIGVSADGRVVVGNAETESGYGHAFRHSEGDAKMTDLGTLTSDNIGKSSTTTISADGRVVVGNADTDSGYAHAFRHNEGDAKITDLGTLKSDNSGYSSATAVSADGRVVVGISHSDTGYNRAFIHNEGDLKMTDIGTLKSDNSGFSSASAVSADGHVVVGSASTDSGDTHVFRRNEGDLKMTGLGTLTSDNSGQSYARGLSSNGRVVVGEADTDSGYYHAFRHNEGDAKMTDLGTLTSDNSRGSMAFAVSADGRVVVGQAETDSGYFHAFIHNEGDVKMTDLGTLTSDNSGFSIAFAVSADGRVVVGQAETDSGEYHTFIYKNKLKEDGGSEDGGGGKDEGEGGGMIDADDSYRMLQKGAEQQTAALSFLQDKLTDALFQGCRPDSGNTCFSAGAKYDQQSNNEINDTAAYVNIAHRFQPKVYAGIYLEQSVSSGFANTIDASNEQPLVSVYGGFSPSGNNLGLQIRAAAATHKINADITRPSITNTEAGKGSTHFKGYSGQLEAAYALQVTDKMIVSPVVGIRYSQVERGAYTESSSVDFPYQYDKMESKQSNLFAGIQTELSLSKKVNMYANIGLEQVLDHSEKAFSANEQYLRGLKYNNPDVRHTKAYASTWMSYEVAPNQKIGLGIGYRQASFKSSRDGLSANLGYTVQF